LTLHSFSRTLDCRSLASIPFVEQVGHGCEKLRLFRHLVCRVQIDQDVAGVTLSVKQIAVYFLFACQSRYTVRGCDVDHAPDRMDDVMGLP
jgi:hypothetical protein